MKKKADKQTIDNLARESFLRLTNGSENADKELFYRHGFADGFTKGAEIVADDMTRWRDCDRITEKPSEEYYRLHLDWVLVKVKERATGWENPLPYIAEYGMVSHKWNFRDSDEENPYFKDLKVISWRPIH